MKKHFIKIAIFFLITCSYSYGQPIQPKQILKASEPGYYALFSKNIVATDSLVLIGTIVYNKAFLFKKFPNGEWNEIQIVIPSEASGSEMSVGISDKNAIIGRDSMTIENYYYAGAVYLFDLNENNVLIEKQRLVSPDTTSWEFFGISVSISGDFLLVGTNGPNGCYIFEKNEFDYWHHTFTLESSTPNPTVIIAGNYAAVSSGNTVKILERETGLWKCVDTIFGNPNVYPYNRGVDIDGERIIIGFENPLILERNIEGDWIQKKQFIPNISQPGYPVCIEGNNAIIGLESEGAVYFLEEDNAGEWDLSKTIDNPDPDNFTSFGWSVAISKGDFMIGANGVESSGNFDNYNEPGAIFVYDSCSIRRTIGKTAICMGDSILLGGEYRKTPGIYYDWFTAINGCDSLVETTLQVNPNNSSTINRSICDNDSILWEGQYYNEPGNYETSYNTINGCDSILTMNLSIEPTFKTNKQETICEGDSIYLAGDYQKQAGIFYDTLVSSLSCDSVIITSLITNPSYFESFENTICEGDSLYWQGHYYKEAGTYYSSNLTLLGCDSIKVLTLSLYTIYNSQANAIICGGDSLLWEGSYYNEQGAYETNYYTINGCDSTFNLILSINPKPADFTITGSPIVSEYAIVDYSVPYDLDLTYSWEVYNGNLTSIPTLNTASIQWGSQGFGFIYVVSANQYQCTSDTTILEVVIGSTGILDYVNNESIIIYPNPANDMITISGIEIYTAEIYSIKGSKLLSASNNEIDIRGLSSGVYFILIKNHNNVLEKIDRLIIKR